MDGNRIYIQIERFGFQNVDLEKLYEDKNVIPKWKDVESKLKLRIENERIADCGLIFNFSTTAIQALARATARQLFYILLESLSHTRTYSKKKETKIRNEIKRNEKKNMNILEKSIENIVYFYANSFPFLSFHSFPLKMTKEKKREKKPSFQPRTLR